MTEHLDPQFELLLRHMLTISASDLYLTVDSPPIYRVEGVGHAGKVSPTGQQLALMADALMSGEQREEFRRTLEMNLAVAIEATPAGADRPGPQGRFRVNVFRQRGEVGMVVRLVRTEIKSLDELSLPAVLEDIAMSKRGLAILAGSTGSGKSTTLAAMLDHRNASETGHIITVEDPIEFMHPHKRCVVTQREVGLDTRSFRDALKNTLRQAPDVILIGEIRDVETMEAAISFAETGHLCLTTLHANSANQAIERILNFFPTARHHEILMQLSLNLRAIVSQRLVPAIGGGRAAALEILLDTPRIKDLVKRGEIDVVKDAMEQGLVEGCQTFDGALLSLVTAGRVSPEEALRHADSANNLRLKIEQIPGGLGASAAERPLRLANQPGRKLQAA
jgi:twitching motility protein PilU